MKVLTAVGNLPDARAAAERTYSFGPFTFDPREGLLRRSGQPVPLVDKAVRLLGMLLEAEGAVVTKEALLQRVWSGVFIEENTIAKTVSLLRNALGERRYVQTVTRRGYRFAAPVRAVAVAPEPRAEVRSLALLPIASAHPGLEYVCDGLTERLIATLSRLPQLRLMARGTVQRYREVSADPVRVAADLGVDAVCVGTLGRSGRAVELQYELCDRHGARLGGGRLVRGRSELTLLERDVARDVAAALDREEPDPAPGGASRSSKAYHLYLKGNFHINKRNPRSVLKGADYFRQALREDPRLALAHVGLASAYSSLSWIWVGTMAPQEARPIIEASARKALELDPLVAEAHVLQASYDLWHTWNWRRAERSLRQALDLDPHCVLAHIVYGFLLTCLGRFNEAESELQFALEIDPLSFVVEMNLAWLSYVRGRYDDAIARAEEALELEPAFGPARVIIALAYAALGLHRRALEESERALASVGGAEANSMIAAMQARCLRWNGQPARAARAARELEELSRRRYVSAVDLALAHDAAGDTKSALKDLERALVERPCALLIVRFLPFSEVTRRSRRYASVVRRLRLR